MSQTNNPLPKELFPEIEAWGRYTAQVFGKLRRETRMKPQTLAQMNDEMASAFSDLSPQEIETIVDEAVTEVRVSNTAKN